MEKLNLVADADGRVFLEISQRDLCVVKELTRFQVAKLLMQAQKLFHTPTGLYESAKPGYFLFAQKIETREKQEVRMLLELFDLFHDLDDRSIQVIFREITDNFIRCLSAVYGALGETEKRDRFYRNIPKIKRNIIEEDVNNMQSIEVCELEKIVEKFLDIIYRLNAEGQILLREKG